MTQTNSFFLLLLFLIISMGVVSAQTPSPTPAQSSAMLDGIGATGAIGEVISVDTLTKQMTVKTKDGEIAVQLNDTTQYLLVQPGAKSLSEAKPITISEVGLGDRIWARGKVTDDKKSVPAKQVILMTKADITKRQEREREEWKRRGLTGRITEVNASTYEIKVSVRSFTTEAIVTLVDAGKAKIRRYAPDSVKFSDAKPAQFFDMKVGDQLRALGNKSADGKTFTPEEVVSGSFKTVAGTVTAIDPEKGEITIKDMQNEKKSLIIVVAKDTAIRRLPQMQMFGGMGGGQPQGGQSGGQPQGGQRQTQNPQGGQPQGGNGQRMMGGGNFDLDEMIERIPTVTIAELKVGDLIGASSSTGLDPSRVTAIKLLADIEPLVRMQQMQQAQRQGMGRGGQSPSLDLPGLDIGLP